LGKPFRVIDTGLRPGRANIAFDAALIEAHKAGAIPDTVRFLRFPPTALVGRHQALAQEIRLDHCRRHGIGVARRITGGGAIYFDEGQLGWELVFRRDTLAIGDLASLTRSICEAAAAGLGRLGVPARFRPRNDIEVEGRKLCGTGGFFDGDTLFYQGTVLIDMDPLAMVAALKVPEEKLKKRQLDSAAARVATLRQLLGDGAPGADAVKHALLEGFAERLGIEPAPGAPTEHEEALARKLHDEEIGTDGFVHEIDDPGADEGVLVGVHTGAGGTVRAYLRLEGPGGSRVREALVTGDFFVTPPRTIFDLEASLRGVAVDEIADTVARFFSSALVGLLSIRPEDFAAALTAAAHQAR
jgi:lipoate-protein ligase A